MNKKYIKRIVASLLCIVVVFTSLPPVYAGSIPSKYEPYVADGRVDYLTLHKNYFQEQNSSLTPPTSSFTVTVMRSGQKVSSTDSDSGQILYAQVGDTLTIQNTSTIGSGSSLSKADFQISDGTSIIYSTTSLDSVNLSKIPTDKEGTYNIYLNVMDNEVMTRTEGWGNWAYNGSHVSPGTNPGGGTGSDFPGWWYYSKLTVEIKKPVYSLTEAHIDADSGVELSKTVYRNITETTKTTSKKDFPGYTFTGSREGYTWDELEASPTDISKTSRTANFTSEHKNAFHYYYYKKQAGLFANFAIKYGGSDFTDKELVAMNLPVTVNLEDLSVGDNITSWTWEYKTPEMPAFQQFSTVQNPTMELTEEKTYTFRLTVKNATQQNSITHNVTVKKGNPPPENQPPEMEILGPKQKLAGENVNLDGSSSYDPDGVIAQYVWDYPDANFVYSNKAGDRLTIWYPYVGNYTRSESVTLTGTDDKGATGEASHSIDILPPTPAAVLNISGIYKENRKVTLDASASYSPSRYPINNYQWAITNAANVKSITPLNGNAKNDVMYKIAGIYDNTITASNTVGLSASVTKPVTIVADQNPNVNFAVTTKLLREPTDSNQALITISNLTISPDGDPIKKVIVFYAYDSDNDGNFDEEIWKYSTNGTTWQNAGLTYAQIRTGFDIYNIAGGNPLTFTIKTNQVGKYKFEAMAIEDIPAADTIPTLLTPTDYRRSDTFTAKPDSQKIVDVINTAPTVTFEVKKKKEVDILIATDYTGQKLADLQTALNVQKANLLAKNIDVKYTIVNSASPVAHINDAQYWYKRYGRYNFQADKETWSSSGNGNSDDDEDYSEAIVWEETTALESESVYLPLRNPSNLRWWKSSTLNEEEPDDPTPDWERYYYNVYMQVANDGYRNYGVLDFTKARYNGLQSSSGMTYGYEYSDIENESVTVDAGWQREEKIADVTVNVNSINFASVTSTPLRVNSDRYLLFIGDSNSKIYSGAWGTHFPFGGLTKSEQDYIKANNIKPYIVTPQTTLDTIVGAEKAKEVTPSNGFAYFKAFDGTTKLLFNDGYPINIDVGSEIKAVYGNYVLLENNTLKYRASGANYNTLATNVTKVMQEKNGYNSSIGNIGNLWVVTSDGKLRQYVNGVLKRTLGYSDALDIYHGGSIAYFDSGSYIISSTSGTYFINGTGQVKFLYGAPVSGFNYIDARDRRDGDLIDYTLVLIYKNGYVQLWREWIESDYDYDTGVTTRWIKDLNALTLYKSIYNSTTGTYSYSGFPWVTPTTGMNSIINNGLYEIDGISYIYESTARKEYYYIDMTSPAYKATGVSNVVNGVRYFTNGTIGVPSTYYKKTIGYKGSVSYSWVTVYADVPVLRGKTISKVFTGNGATSVLTSDNQFYKWADQTAYTTVPIINFTLATNNTGGAFSNTYNINSNWKIVSVTNNYYWDKNDNTLKRMDDDTVVFSNVVDVKISSDRGNVYVVTSDGKLYGQGYFGSTRYSGGRSYPVGDSFHELVKTRIVKNDTTKQYITLRDIMTEVPTTKYYSAGQYQQAIDDITNFYLDDSSYLTNYIVVNDTVDYKVVYNDYEKDGKYTENWTYNHEPDYFENSMGIASFHGKTLTAPITKFDKKGRFTINVRARDNPKSDDRFDNYRLWSTGSQNVTLYVHEKPVALFRVNVTPNGDGTFSVEAIDAGSYDRDHTSRADKGIAAREWRWKEKAELNWRSERINKADCSADKIYIIQLRVRDLEGAWSDYMTVELDAANPPIALFTVDNTPLSMIEPLKVKDQSFPQSLSTITSWNWIVKKFIDDDTLPAAELQNEQYGTSNNGSGSLTGYDINVKTNYNDSGPGKYRIYLRVKDSNGLWSDGGTDASYNLDSFYYQDIIVQESYKLMNFTVVKVRDLHLDSYYYNATTGEYDDKPITVNNMAIDYQNFGSIVDGLTKGYLFEFEIDTTNFNENDDTIVITPHFYTADLFTRDEDERDLFWENSRHEILEAGQGGHSNWAAVTLDRNDRTITGTNNATWRGSYLIPGTAWAVPMGTSSSNAKASRIDRDIIVNFEIKGYKGGVMRYDYNLQQWPLERTAEKLPYKVGDVIRYSHIKSNLDDNNIIINRP